MTRPGLHFTVREGWTNDPHGIVYDGARYHLFFQYNPAGTVWAPAIHWGHAVSDDLVSWVEQRVALSPTAGEVGCWSGAVVVDDGTPTILYTRVAGDDLGRGQVAVARGSAAMDSWRREPAEPVVDGPPADLDTTGFRDPFVWRVDDGWRMVMGAGTAEGNAAILQYSSPDLVSWQYDGVLAARHTSLTEPVWTGRLWECPQLFELDGTWVLIASVWDDDELHYVVYALGDYDGAAFVPRTWGRFSHGDQMYATTTFLDAAGRRCAMSWIREAVDAATTDSPYAGAMTLPHVLSVEGHRLVVRQHPALDARAVDQSEDAAIHGPTLVEIRSDPDEDVELAFTSATGTSVLHVELSNSRGEMTVRDATRSLLTMPLGDAAEERVLSLVIDQDILEVTVSGAAGIAVIRIPPLDGTILRSQSRTGDGIHAVRIAALSAQVSQR